MTQVLPTAAPAVPATGPAVLGRLRTVAPALVVAALVEALLIVTGTPVVDTVR
jgi:hypothetical protein